MDAGGVSHYKLSLSTSAPFKEVDRDNLSQVRSLLRQKPSFDSAQDDVTLSGVEVLSTLKFLCINLTTERGHINNHVGKNCRCY